MTKCLQSKKAYLWFYENYGEFCFICYFYIFFFNFILWPLPWEVPKAGVEFEPQLQPLLQVWQCRIL